MLGPETFGRYAEAILCFGILDTVSGLGVAGVLAGFVARIGGTLGASDLLRLMALKGGLALLLVAGLGGAVAAGIADLGPGQLAMASVSVFSFWAYWDSYLQGKGFVVRGARIRLTIGVAGAVLRLVLADSLGTEIGPWAAVFAAEHLLLSLATGLVALRVGRGAARSIPFRLPALIRSALPYWGASLSTLVYMRIDQSILALKAEPAALAAYFSAVSILEQAFTIPVIINAVFVKRIGEAQTAGTLGNLMPVIYRIGVTVGGAASLVLIFGATTVRDLLAVAPNQPFPLLLAMLALSVPLVAVGGIHNCYLVVVNREGVILRKTLAAAFAAVLVSWLCFDLWGVVGLAVSYVFSQLVSCILINLMLDRELFEYLKGTCQFSVSRL